VSNIKVGRNINIMLLLFADDMVVMAETAENLQESLNRVYEYCEKWGLEVNVEKTKIVVFRKRGKVVSQWYFDKELVEVVDSFIYLGVVSNYNGSFTSHC
jgi:hypothetical protein